MYCPKCGTKLADSCKFCPKCGTKMAVRNTETTPKEEKPAIIPKEEKPAAVPVVEKKGKVVPPTPAPTPVPANKPSAKSNGAVKWILIGVGVLLILGGGVLIGSKYLSSHSPESATEACADSTAAEEAEAKELTASEFVKAAYEDAWNGNGEPKDYDAKYCSKAYNELAKKVEARVKQVEAAKGTDETWYYEDNHWTAAMYASSFSVESVSEKKAKGDATMVVIKIKSDEGESAKVEVLVKKENGKFVIDDFSGEVEYYTNYLNSLYTGMKLKDVCKLDGVKWVVTSESGGNYVGYFLAVRYKGQDYATNASYSWARGEESIEGLTEEGKQKLADCPAYEEKIIQCTPSDFTDDATIM